jgi:hypothetical protein
MIHRVNYKPLIILLVILGISTGIYSQYSRTYDLYGFSSETGRDLIKVDDKTFVTAASVCEFPVRFCTDLVCFSDDGELEWVRKLNWMSTPNQAMTVRDNEIYLVAEGNTAVQEFIVYKSSTSGDSLGVLRVDMDNAWREISLLSMEDTGNGLILNGSISNVGDDGQDALIAWINYDLTLDTLIIQDDLGPQSTFLQTQTLDNNDTHVFFIGTENNPNNNGLLYHRGILNYDSLKRINIIYETEKESTFFPVGANFDIFLNGNYVFINQNGENFDAPKIQCFAPSGDLLWEYIYEYQLNQHAPLDLEILEDETILLCGRYTSIGDDISAMGFTMKLSNNGDLLWSRYYSVGNYADNVHESLAGKERMSRLYSLFILEDSIYLTGSASNLEFDEEWHNHSDIWLLKVGEDGCFIPDCTNWQNVSSTADYNLENKNITLYPVPTSDILNIDYMGDGSYETIIIYDLQGQPIYTIIGSTDQIEVSILPSGVYVARFYDRDNQTIAVKKFSKL